MSDKPKHGPPHGMEKYDLGLNDPKDLGALSAAQQADLNDFKVDYECILSLILTPK